MQHLDTTYQTSRNGQLAYPSDSCNMIEDINGLASHGRIAWSKVKQFAFPFDPNEVEQVIFAGMGGSAIIGDILHRLITPIASIPFVVNRGYHLPGFMDKRSLVIVSSHSGETAEALACFKQAHAAGAMVLALGTGGRLAALAKETQVPFVRYEFAGQPRAAFGHAFVSLLGIANHLGLLPDPGADIEEACFVVEHLTPRIGLTVPTDRNPAKQLAVQFYERIPFIYAGPLLGSVAHRWKNQLNENSKAWADWDELPEMNHNSVAGYDHPDLWTKASIAFLMSSHDGALIAARLAATEHVLRQRGLDSSVIQAEGTSKLAQVFWSVHFSDYVSYYLASLYHTDPSPIEAITQLKKRLVL